MADAIADLDENEERRWRVNLEAERKFLEVFWSLELAIPGSCADPEEVPAEAKRVQRYLCPANGKIQHFSQLDFRRESQPISIEETEKYSVPRPKRGTVRAVVAPQSSEQTGSCGVQPRRAFRARMYY
jgi:hypothetical protein